MTGKSVTISLAALLILFHSHALAGQPGYDRARVAVKALLKDPYSAKFTRIAPCRKGFVWGTVNAKNSFGAYSGDKMFVTDGGRFTYILSDDPGDNIVPNAIIRSNCTSKK